MSTEKSDYEQFYCTKPCTDFRSIIGVRFLRILCKLTLQYSITSGRFNMAGSCCLVLYEAQGC